MKDDSETRTCFAAEKYIERSKGLSPSCNALESNRMIHDSMSVGALQFYPLHVTFLKFCNERRRNLITSGKTIVACREGTFEIFQSYTCQQSQQSFKSEQI